MELPIVVTNLFNSQQEIVAAPYHMFAEDLLIWPGIYWSVVIRMYYLDGSQLILVEKPFENCCKALVDLILSLNSQ